MQVKGKARMRGRGHYGDEERRQMARESTEEGNREAEAAGESKNGLTYTRASYRGKINSGGQIYCLLDPSALCFNY